MLVLRACLQQSNDEAILADLGSGATTVADIIPELRDRLKLSKGKQSADSTAARYQLFDSVTRFLLNTARRKPLIILFDNPTLPTVLRWLCWNTFANRSWVTRY